MIAIPGRNVGLALILSAWASVAAAQGRPPAELVADASRHGCTIVTDTTEYTGESVRFFRYGVLEATDDSLARRSAAYWCERAVDERPALLVIWRADAATPIPGGCGAVIKYRNPPASLRFERRAFSNLADFNGTDAPYLRGPATTVSGTVIVSEYGGVISSFVCHEGQWYVRIQH